LSGAAAQHADDNLQERFKNNLNERLAALVEALRFFHPPCRGCFRTVTNGRPSSTVAARPRPPHAIGKAMYPHPQPWTRHRCRLRLALLLLLACAGAWADPHDHDRARAARERQEVRPLAEILDLLAKQVPGDVVEVELEREHGAWVYEIKVIAPDGRVLEVLVDAADGRLLEQEADD
jgi:hypothetical protein